MTTHDKRGLVNDRRKTGQNKNSRYLRLLMSLVDPSAVDERAKAADKGIGYVELTSEAEEKLFRAIMKKISHPPASM